MKRGADEVVAALRGARRRRRAAPALAFVVLLAAAVAAVAVVAPQRTALAFKAVFASLLETRRPASRAVEARLTGDYAWAPFQRHRDATRPASDLRLASTLGAAVTLRNASQPESLHANGVAQLIGGNGRQAVASLTAAAEATNDGRIWSDLAVALFETASRYEAPELLADALAACDRAIAADSRLLEPFFNRALVLERLGLRDEARDAWAHYLARDGSSSWAVEARDHLRRFVRDTPFLERIDAAAGRAIDIREQVRANAQEARARTEMQLLGRWGKAVGNGDAAAADRYLRTSREIGGELVALNGDRMVASAVAAIDAAGGAAIDAAGGAARTALAAGHSDYEDGLALFQSNRPSAAEPLLRRAATSFEAGGSPMARRARFFAANTAFEQGRREEGQRAVEQLLATTPPELQAARAELLWQLGTCHATRAEWGPSIRSLEQSAAIFDELGEVRNAASVRRVVAVIFDRLGDAGRAWQYRMAALRGIGSHSDLALEKGIASIADAAILRGKWHTAMSFLTLEISIARRISDQVQLGVALLSRAAVHARLGNVADARGDLADAARAWGRSNDPAYAAYGRAAASLVEATLAASPREAVSLLNGAIALHSTAGDRMNLPALLLERGRAKRKTGDVAAAAADYEAGIAELERHRESLPAGDMRWGAFFAAEELFEEAIDLSVDREDASHAFAVAERARARVLLESYGRSPSATRLPAEGTVIVEYAALPSRLVAFVVSASGVRAVATACDRATLAAEVDAFAAALRANQSAAMRDAAAALYRRLIAPVAAQLTDATTVAFVPDPTTATVPFNALVDEEGRYLIERHPIVVTPSAAVFASASRRRATSAPKSVAVIASADGAGGQNLVSVAAEARAVAAAYPAATRLEGDDVTLESVERALSSADVVHFAGHAVGDDSGLVPASIVLRRDGREHRITATDVARLRARETETVVLAGCSTARGEKRGIEGALSVAHGFLVAGAPSVIATLWPIDDRAAAVFFPRLHQRLSEGLPAAEALRAVQLDAIRRGDVPPSLWAALIDIGS